MPLNTSSHLDSVLFFDQQLSREYWKRGVPPSCRTGRAFGKSPKSSSSFEKSVSTFIIPPHRAFDTYSELFREVDIEKCECVFFFLKEKKLGRKIPLVVCARKSWEFSVRELLKVWESERETFWSSPSKLRRSLCLLGPDQSGVGEKFNKRITRIRRVPTQKINDTVATFWANTWGIEFLRGTVGTTLLRGPLNPTPSVLGKIIKIKKLARGERRPAFLRFSWAQCEIDGLQSCSARKSI